MSDLDKYQDEFKLMLECMNILKTVQHDDVTVYQKEGHVTVHDLESYPDKTATMMILGAYYLGCTGKFPDCILGPPSSKIFEMFRNYVEKETSNV